MGCATRRGQQEQNRLVDVAIQHNAMKIIEEVDRLELRRAAQSLLLVGNSQTNVERLSKQCFSRSIGIQTITRDRVTWLGTTLRTSYMHRLCRGWASRVFSSSGRLAKHSP